MPPGGGPSPGEDSDSLPDELLISDTASSTGDVGGVDAAVAEGGGEGAATLAPADSGEGAAAGGGEGAAAGPGAADREAMDTVQLVPTAR